MSVNLGAFGPVVTLADMVNVLACSIEQQATQLHDGIDLMLKEMPTKTRPRSVADAVNTYLALDPLQQSTEDLEKIVYRAKAYARHLVACTQCYTGKRQALYSMYCAVSAWFPLLLVVYLLLYICRDVGKSLSRRLSRGGGAGMLAAYNTLGIQSNCKSP